RLVQNRPNRHRRDRRRARPRRVRRRLATRQGLGLGGRHACHPKPRDFTMTCHRLRAALAAGVAMLTLATANAPTHAQWIVYDPTNFSQNVLTAARELQQVNQNIQSLENQAKNLASLPYSSLAQLEASIQRTEQLLMQAQNIAYSVTTIDQAFTQVYPQAYSS